MDQRQELEAELSKIADELTVEESDYPWAADWDEERRCFILQHVGLDYGIAYLEELFQWMKHGTVPSSAAPKKVHK